MNNFLKYIFCFLFIFVSTLYGSEEGEINSDSFVLEAGDTIGVWVMGEPELSVDTAISDDGTILMPLIGYVNIAGKTKKEAIELIEEAYRDGYLQKPIVHMAVRITARVYENSEDDESNEESDEIDEAGETDGISLYNDERAAKLELAKNGQTKEKHKYLMLTVIDAQTKRSIKHADIIFPNKKTRYTDRNGYVKLPLAMAGNENPVDVQIYHKSYEPLSISLDYEGEQAVTARLRKSFYDKPQEPIDKNALLETARNILLYKPDEILESKISLEFYDTDLKTILKALTARFDLALQISDDSKKYSIHAEDVTVRELLRSLLLAHDCQYSINDGSLNVFLPIGAEEKTAREILFRDMSLKEALRTLASMMKINLFLSPKISDCNVNFYVESLNLNELFNLVLETNNLNKVYKGNNSFYIEPR